MSMVLSGLSIAAALWSLFENEPTRAVAFFAWAAALYNRHDLGQLRKELGKE